MATNQEGVQASIRSSTGTTLNYQGDWHALFDDAGIASGTFNERMLAWINDRLGESYTNLPGAMHAFAVDQGFDSWSAMNDISTSSYVAPPATNIKAYWDVSVLSSLYQERTGSGTTPAVVDGVVGTIRDLSGNGFHLVAPTDAGRGILRQSGSEYYIEMDGTDDAYLANWTQISQPNTFCVAWRQATTGTGWIVGPYDATHRNEFFQGSGNFRLFPPGNNIITVTNNTQYVHTAIFNGASGNLRTNGVASTAQNTGTTQWSGVSVGAFTGTGNWTVMRFYALAAYDGLVSGGDLTDLEAWASSKNGVTLP